MARRLPKSEGRDPKAERNPKPEGDGKRRELSVFEIRTFGLLSAFGFGRRGPRHLRTAITP